MWDNYVKYSLPLDVIWIDIDYMDRFRDFTWASNLTWAGLDTFVQSVHTSNLYFVPIMDAGVALTTDEDYYPGDLGIEWGAFIKSGNQN